MTLKFNHGFEYSGFQYGWHNKDVYRLPSVSGNNSYGLKKLNPIQVGNKTGYRIKRQKLTIEQLKAKSVFIGKEIHIVSDSKNIPE